MSQPMPTNLCLSSSSSSVRTTLMQTISQLPNRKQDIKLPNRSGFTTKSLPQRPSIYQKNTNTHLKHFHTNHFNIIRIIANIRISKSFTIVPYLTQFISFHKQPFHFITCSNFQDTSTFPLQNKTKKAVKNPIC